MYNIIYWDMYGSSSLCMLTTAVKGNKLEPIILPALWHKWLGSHFFNIHPPFKLHLWGLQIISIWPSLELRALSVLRCTNSKENVEQILFRRGLQDASTHAQPVLQYRLTRPESMLLVPLCAAGRKRSDHRVRDGIGPFSLELILSLQIPRQLS